MSTRAWGELCALLAPLAWSVAVILFRRSAGGASPFALNLFKNTLALAPLSVTLLAAGVEIPRQRPPLEWARLALSATLGLAVADTMLLAALQRIGAARLAVVDTVYAPTVVALSWLWLGEVPSGTFLVGAAAVVVGIALATIRRAEDSAPELARGTLYGLGAIVGTATGVVVAKPVLEHSNLLEVTWTRLAFGVSLQLLWAGVSGSWSQVAQVFRPGPTWRTLVPATLVGTYLSLLLWLGGFKWAPASVAATLNQMATIYVLVLARWLLGETLRPVQVLGALVAAAGALWIVMGRP